MRNKKGMLMGETTIKILVAIIVTLLLIGLGFAIYGLLIPDTSYKDAEKELDLLLTHFQSLSAKDPGPIQYLTMHTPEWRMFSSERGGTLCDGKFCLCLCKYSDCKQKDEKEQDRACIATDTFIALRERKENEESYMPKRTIRMTQAPEEMFIYFIDEEVFPSRSSPQENTWSISTGRPIYLKYDGGWNWTGNFVEWKPLSDTSSSEWNYISPRERDFVQAFERELAKFDDKEEEGEIWLLNHKRSKSYGVYAIEKIIK